MLHRKLEWLVQKAFHDINDIASLADNPFSGLKSAERLATNDGSPRTSLDRGRGLRTLLIIALEELKPQEEENISDIWYPYTILHDLYVGGKSTKELMGLLDLREGTFRRIRRKALNTVAKVVREIEDQTV